MPSHYLKLLGEKHIYNDEYHYILGSENEFRKRTNEGNPKAEGNENKDRHEKNNGVLDIDGFIC
jgi:hypothetical protein